MSERRFNFRQWALHVGLAGAWIFALGTLAALVFIAWVRWPGTDQASHLLGVTVEGELYAAFGFRYVGVPGTVLVLAEALFVAAGIVLSVVPRRSLRRIGHVMLLAWAGLWLGSAVSLAWIARDFTRFVWVGLLGLLFLCTLLRAARAWKTWRSPRKPAEADVAA